MAPKPGKKTAPAKLSQLQQLIAKQKETEKALAVANAQRLCYFISFIGTLPIYFSVLLKRNQELLDEEDEEVPRPRKRRYIRYNKYHLTFHPFTLSL